MRASPLGRAVVVALLLVGAPRAALAWEHDVHYGLTKWLALKAGFSSVDAEIIAAEDRKVDESWLTGPMHMTVISACFGLTSTFGSGNVHDRHFASKVNPPDNPAKRVVKPKEVWRGVLVPTPIRLGDSYLTDLGAYLHTLQDTWSHQGEPDVPPFCDARYGWGHARDRGGWSCHLADLTYWWARKRRDVLPMAERTYAILVAGAGTKSAPRWQALQREVDEFAHLRTKWDKDQWFTARGFSDTSFIELTSLPDCIGGNCQPYHYKEVFALWDQIVSNNVPVRDVPGPVSDFFNRALQVISRVPSVSIRTLSEYADLAGGVRALTDALGLETPCPALNDMLASWMLGNEFATGRGGETPVVLCEAAATLRETGAQKLSCQQAVDLVTKMIGEAPPRAPPPSAASIPFVFSATTLTRPNEPPKYLAFARFQHLPNEILVLTADDRPRITEFVWLPIR